jgi:hypothetical protein
VTGEPQTANDASSSAYVCSRCITRVSFALYQPFYKAYDSLHQPSPHHRPHQPFFHPRLTDSSLRCRSRCRCKWVRASHVGASRSITSLDVTACRLCRDGAQRHRSFGRATRLVATTVPPLHFVATLAGTYCNGDANQLSCTASTGVSTLATTLAWNNRSILHQKREL